METILEHPEGKVSVEELYDGKIHINILESAKFTPIKSYITTYPINLIKKILEVKGPSYLCDEIRRDEDPNYVESSLRFGMLSYVRKGNFYRKRILDFGSGSGSSTTVLARLFPDSQIVGIELEAKFITLAKMRVDYYGYNNVSFLLSSRSDELPPNIEKFDYISLSAVYEHLLPTERRILMPKLWSILEPGGVLFINQTPYRFFPIESHTTGLPFINYLPDNIALLAVKKFLKGIESNITWITLLRKGIRGGTIKEIRNNLSRGSYYDTILLEPFQQGIKDRIDLWYISSKRVRFSKIKLLLKIMFRIIKYISGIEVIPNLTLAFKKPSNYA